MLRSLPPLKPVRPNVFSPCRLAQSTAASTLGLLPDPLMASTRSPAAVVHQLLHEDLVIADVIAHGHDPAQVVGQAEHLEPLLAFVFQILGFVQAALPRSSAKCEAVVPDPPLPKMNTNLFVLPGWIDEVGHVADLGLVDAVDLGVQAIKVRTNVKLGT